MRVSEWINEDHCSFRIIADGDPNNIAHRVAFIEKTPRVRVAPFSQMDEEHGKWLQGPKGQGGSTKDVRSHGLYGFYGPSRTWCDSMLRSMGYLLPEDRVDYSRNHLDLIPRISSFEESDLQERVDYADCNRELTEARSTLGIANKLLARVRGLVYGGRRDQALEDINSYFESLRSPDER